MEALGGCPSMKILRIESNICTQLESYVAASEQADITDNKRI